MVHRVAFFPVRPLLKDDVTIRNVLPYLQLEVAYSLFFLDTSCPPTCDISPPKNSV